MAWKLKSIWYRPPSLNTRLNDDELSRRFDMFHDWYRATHGKEYNPEPVFTETVRDTILKEIKVIGEREGAAVEIRATTQCYAFPYTKNPERELKSEGIVCPGLHIVMWKGKRVDAFLSAKRAKECALAFINQNPR